MNLKVVPRSVKAPVILEETQLKKHIHLKKCHHAIMYGMPKGKQENLSLEYKAADHKEVICHEETGRHSHTGG